MKFLTNFTCSSGIPKRFLNSEQTIMAKRSRAENLRQPSPRSLSTETAGSVLIWVASRFFYLFFPFATNLWSRLSCPITGGYFDGLGTKHISRSFIYAREHHHDLSQV